MPDYAPVPTALLCREMCHAGEQEVLGRIVVGLILQARIARIRAIQTCKNGPHAFELSKFNCICFRGPQMTTHFIVGESHIPGMDEGLVGMCPGDIHRVHSPSVGGISIHILLSLLR